MNILKQSTAVDVLIGPFVDSTDGDTEEIALTINRADVLLSKNGQALTQKTDITAAVHDADGYYNCEFDAIDTDTVGNLVLTVHVAGALAVRHTFQVVDAAAYDDIFGAATTALAKAAALTTVDTIVDSILVDTAEIGAAGAGLTILATQASVDTVDGVVDSILVDTSTSLPSDIAGVQADTDDIQSRLPAALAGGRIDANVGAISGDVTAADNLKLQYDGTGLTGDNFPATQAEVGNIGAATGGAINVEVAEDNTTAGPIDPLATVFVGSVTSGTLADTQSENGISHVLAATGGNLVMVQGFSIGGARTATKMSILANVDDNADSIKVYAYNHTGSAWEEMKTIDGSGGTSFKVVEFELLSKHTGSGTELGKAYIKFDEDGSTPSGISIQKSIMSAVNIGQSVGYALGRVWLDTIHGAAGTEPFVNGVADKPCLTIADTVAVAASVNLHEFGVSPESVLTLVADLQNVNVYGVGYALNFAGFDASGTHFFHASPVNGIVTSSVVGEHVDIVDSIIVDVTVNDAHFTNCSFKGTVTMDSVASDVQFVNCRSIIAGASTPIFDFGVSVVNHNVTFANWQNGMEIRNFNQSGTDLMSLSGTGKIVIAASCTGGTINLRGQWQIVDNSGGAVSIAYDDVHADVIAIMEDTGTDGVVLSTATMDAIATALLDLTAGCETGVTFREFMRISLAAAAGKVSGGGTTTVAIRNQADTKDRILATVDPDGNRTAITTDLT